MHPDRRYDLIAVGLMGSVTLLFWYFWPELPADMAIHWSGKTPDSFVSKPIAVFGLLAFGIGTVAFVRLAPPSLRNTDPNITVLFIGVVFAWAHGLVLVWNLGYQLNMALAVLSILILVGLFVAYAYLDSPTQWPVDSAIEQRSNRDRGAVYPACSDEAFANGDQPAHGSARVCCPIRVCRPIRLCGTIFRHGAKIPV